MTVASCNRKLRRGSITRPDRPRNTLASWLTRSCPMVCTRTAHVVIPPAARRPSALLHARAATATSIASGHVGQKRRCDLLKHSVADLVVSSYEAHTRAAHTPHVPGGMPRLAKRASVSNTLVRSATTACGGPMHERTRPVSTQRTDMCAPRSLHSSSNARSACSTHCITMVKSATPSADTEDANANAFRTTAHDRGFGNRTAPASTLDAVCTTPSHTMAPRDAWAKGGRGCEGRTIVRCGKGYGSRDDVPALASLGGRRKSRTASGPSLRCVKRAAVCGSLRASPLAADRARWTSTHPPSKVSRKTCAASRASNGVSGKAISM